MNSMMRIKGRTGVLLLALALRAHPAWAGMTNSVPWNDPFESYSPGMALQSTHGWSSARTGAGWVTNTPSVIDALTNTFAGSYAYPPVLAATSHTAVAEVVDLLDNDVRSSTGGVVVMDFLALPTPGDMDPPGETNLQYAFYIKTNQHLVVWQHSPSTTSNTWLELTQGSPISTGVWTRFTVTQNYTNHLYQIQVNGGAALSDPAGFQADGVTPDGSWFHMVQTNGVLSRVTVGDGATNYVDDFVVARRGLTWSPSAFRESVTNDGSIDSSGPVTVTLLYDTFTGANGDFSSYVQADSGLPEGLSVSALRTSPTNVSLSLSGKATAHDASHSVTNLTVHFTSGAFSLGNAADVENYQNGTLSVAFRDTAVLEYSTNLFRENTVANDGSVNNTPPLTITLTNDVFTGDAGENYATNASKLALSGIPSGLTGQVSKIDDTHVEVTLLGNAVSNASANDTSFTLTFLGPAFATNTVNGTVANYSNTVQIQYVDVRTLTYSTNVFTELPPNDGSVTGTTVSLQFDSFAGADGDDLAAAGVVVAPSLPAGLVLQAFWTSPTVVTLAFSNRATAHTSADSMLGTVAVNFLDGAFASGNAATVAGASRSDLSIVFNDPPVLSMAGGVIFTEAPQNNGAIGNPLPIVLAGETFSADVTSQYAVLNLPDGLVPQMTRDGDTQVTLSLTGQALQHAAAQTTGAPQLVFSNSAFSAVSAADIAGSTTNFTVQFDDQPSLSYGSTVFNELSQGTIDNRDPMIITVSGDTFSAGSGGDLSSLVAVTNLPAGLSAVFTRLSATQLSVSLTGVAAANGSDNSVVNLGFTFLQGAFVNADANQVSNYSRNNLSVVFVNDIGYVNYIPYHETFEAYPDNLLLAGTNGWTADYYPDAAQVTNAASLTTLLTQYRGAGGRVLSATNHVEELVLRDTVRNEIHSPTGQLVYLDFLAIPVAMQDRVDNDTNLQFAFYVDTNSHVVIWHRNTAGAPFNQWLALTNSGPLINTNVWNRFTVAQNYSNEMFQIQVNEGDPIVDPAGWDASGQVQTGSWFHMVNTSASNMSRFIIDGVGGVYIDDLSVTTGLPADFGIGIGSIFKIR